MDCREFISAIIGSLAWPATILLLALIFHRAIKKLINRIQTIKHGDTELSFAQITKNFIQGKTDERSKEKYSQKQVLHEGHGYKLYSNGNLVQKLSSKIMPNATSRELIFPITFPNEVISIQSFGEIDAVVTKLTKSNCTLNFSPSASEREINLIISGL